MNEEKETKPMSLREIAEIEGISHSAVSSLLARAYAKAIIVLKEKNINTTSDLL